jgi:RNA polymerase-binding transcription factor DksA
MNKKKTSSKKIVPKTAKPPTQGFKKSVVKKNVTQKTSKISPKSKSISKVKSRSESQKNSSNKTVVKKISLQAEKKVSKKLTEKKPVMTQATKMTKPTVSTSNKKKQKASPISTHQINRGALQQTFVTRPLKQSTKKLDPFLTKQKQRLLLLKDMLLDSMSGVARGNLRSGCDASGFGMHQADAGSDAYDRDFALSILSQEQNSLYEIDEALKRIDDGTYGICEISNKQILRARLEARPFTRYTVECQADLEKRQHVSGTRVPVSALFGITEEESDAEEEESFSDSSKD